MSVLDEVKSKMAAAIDHLKQELKSLRTGRANPGLVEGVLVEMYGSQMKLKEVATISVPEPRQLLITPFDPQNTGIVSKSIEKANLGLLPVMEGKAIRINIPAMDEARRKEMTTQANKKREECKVAIRAVRRDYNEVVKKQKSSSEITEDVMKKLEKNIQELTDKFCKEADDITAAKEKELMTV